MFENAKWITRHPFTRWGFENNPELLPPSPYITKSFTVDKPIKKVELNIVGLGQATYYFNGERIPDSIRPTQPTVPMKTVVYNTYNLSELIKTGKNRLGVILGNNHYNDTGIKRFRSTTKLLVQLDIEYQDGAFETIVSDTSFKTADSPTLFSLRRCGEKYDARLEIKDWCNPDFDDSNWDNAYITKGPGGLLRPVICPPERVKRYIEGKEISKGLFDFGENTSGWVKMTVKGRCGEEISIKYGEKLTEDGTKINQEGILGNAYRPMAHRDVYILKGENTETFEQLFSYHGFRYAEVEGNYESVKLTAVVVYTDLPIVSSFSSDNEILNLIHSATVRSMETNIHSAPVDCPHREQNEWTGDGMLSAETISVTFDSYNMWYDWMLKYKDDQYPDGALPCIIPMKDENWEYNFANGPDWDSAVFHIPYYAYKYTGNRKIVDTMWENMNRSLNYFGTLSDTHLLSAGVGDWAEYGTRCNKEITDTAYYRIAALMMAEMAEATGRDAAPYCTLAEEIKKEFREKYVLNGEMTDRHQTALAAALFSKMLDGEEIAKNAAILNEEVAKADYCFVCGIHGLRMIFDALGENGYNETVFKTLINAELPGYANAVVKRGLSTLPEHPNYGSSLNHHFRSPVDMWFYRFLAGIHFEGFGTDNVVIKPCFVKQVKKVDASLRGVRVSYNEESFTVNSPYPFTLILKGEKNHYSAGEYIFNL